MYHEKRRRLIRTRETVNHLPASGPWQTAFYTMLIHLRPAFRAETEEAAGAPGFKGEESQWN